MHQPAVTNALNGFMALGDFTGATAVRDLGHPEPPIRGADAG
jgi:hypothetical protein